MFRRQSRHNHRVKWKHPVSWEATMLAQYYVAVDQQGQAGAVHWCRSPVARSAAKSGAQVVAVQAENSFLAKRRALEIWLTGRWQTMH
jgi:hypothetical protein